MCPSYNRILVMAWQGGGDIVCGGFDWHACMQQLVAYSSSTVFLRELLHMQICYAVYAVIVDVHGNILLSLDDVA